MAGKVNQELLQGIEQYITDYNLEHSTSPSLQNIADRFDVGKTTADRYVKRLIESGSLVRTENGLATDAILKRSGRSNEVGLVGSISCGPLTFAEQNVTEYFSLPVSLIGTGEFFMLQASGNSMINAGIDDGDFVIIKKQNTADDGQIVVALYEDETTLKRFYRDRKNKRYILHPENDEMEDIIIEDDIKIQGVAVRILKEAI